MLVISPPSLVPHAFFSLIFIEGEGELVASYAKCKCALDSCWIDVESIGCGYMQLKKPSLRLIKLKENIVATLL